MKPIFKILSTKKLSPIQKEQLSNFEVREENFIEVQLEKKLKIEEKINYAVFTSKNAVKAVFIENKNSINKFKKVACVGNKTALLLEKVGIEVISISNSAEELAKRLIEKNETNKITFFCGNIRRNELPKLLRNNKIKVIEIEAYQTKLIPLKIETEFDAILFFSPSAVKSYVKSRNSIKSHVFCIGSTTSTEASTKFKNVHTAKEPTVESVIGLLKESIK